MNDRSLDNQLGHRLLDERLISSAQLAQAREYQDSIGGPLGKILVKLGHLSEDQVAGLLAEIEGAPYIDLAGETLSPTLMALLPQVMMEQKRVLPIRLEHETLTVAMADPTDLEVVEVLQFETGYSVNPVAAREHEIQEKLNHYFYDGTASSRSGPGYDLKDLVREIEPPAAAVAPEKRRRPAPRPRLVPSRAPAPPAPEQMVSALKALLVRKKIISEQEWAQMLKEITGR